MIDRDTVVKITEEWLKSTDYFLVDVQITENNRIVIDIDHPVGVWVDDCADLSRHIEKKLSKDVEDYELEVGSAGIGQPFKVERQYLNHIGKEVEVLDNSGKKYKGLLSAFKNGKLTLTVKEKVLPDGKKRPILVNKDLIFDVNDIKYTKYVINFK